MERKDNFNSVKHLYSRAAFGISYPKLQECSRKNLQKVVDELFKSASKPEDLKSVEIPVLVLHGEDDQIVPYAIAGPKAAALLPNGKLISYPGFPHGMPTTEAETINKDILAFLKS